MNIRSTTKRPTPAMVIRVELPEAFVEQLSRVSKMTGKTKEKIAVELISEAAEDIGDRLIAEDVMEKLRTGEERTYTWEEGVKEFGLED